MKNASAVFPNKGKAFILPWGGGTGPFEEQCEDGGGIGYAIPTVLRVIRNMGERFLRRCAKGFMMRRRRSPVIRLS